MSDSSYYVAVLLNLGFDACDLAALTDDERGGVLLDLGFVL